MYQFKRLWTTKAGTDTYRVDDESGNYVATLYDRGSKGVSVADVRRDLPRSTSKSVREEYAKRSGGVDEFARMMHSHLFGTA